MNYFHFIVGLIDKQYSLIYFLVFFFSLELISFAPGLFIKKYMEDYFWLPVKLIYLF